MKKNQIIIIVLVAILAVASITFAALYFATDTFKSDKVLFYKYASQIDFKDFVDLESYNNYLKRTETEGHATEGKLAIDFEQGEAISESIKYNGYTDPANKKSSYNITLNANNEELLEMNYINDKDLYGVKFEDIINQYIVVENKNLKEFASKLGMENTDTIPDTIEEIQISEHLNYEEIKPIINKYLNSAIESIPEDKYSKIKKGTINLGDKTVEADGYQINLKAKDIQEILIKILENSKKDEEIFKLINKYNKELQFEDYQIYIDEMIEEISGEISKEENVEILNISVYKQGKNTIKLALNILDKGESVCEIAIIKTNKGLMISYNQHTKMFDIESEIIGTILKTDNTNEKESFEFNIISKSNQEENMNITFYMTRVGSLESNNVEFSMLIPIESDDTKINIEFNSTTNFSATPSLEEFTEGNHIVINTATSEQLDEFFTNLRNRIEEKLDRESIMKLISQIDMEKDSMSTYDETEEENSIADNEDDFNNILYENAYIREEGAREYP